MKKRLFAPGCALLLYKPYLAEKIHKLLNENIAEMDQLLICCHHDPLINQPAEIINICPGCDKRYRNDYPGVSTLSLWEILADSNWFVFPDYNGKVMSILDACPTRDQERVHKAVRKLIERMNITLAEPDKTRTKSTCCGDSFWGTIPVDKVKFQMRKRAREMPVDEVVVYCVSCVKSMFIGGKQPRYLTDLLFSEETLPGTLEPDDWHTELNEYIEKH